ncbi:MAG TPA: GNAT family N-acetyltransferase [Solirubrobacterales bacterium]|nr:GNAT family N-acetyltransferase [Solirubrobacterales bacterium]
MPTRIRLYVKAFGVRGLLAAVSSRLRTLLYVDQRFIVLHKQLDSVVEPRRPGDLRLEDLEAKHLPALADLNRRRGRPQVDQRFAANVASGFRGFVAWRGDRLTGYYWWVDRDAPVRHPDLRDLDLGIELGEGDVYGTDFFLLEEFRGAGTGDDFLYKIEKSLRDRGYRGLWGYVDSGNRPALWLYRSKGHESMWILERKRRLWLWKRTVLSA